MNTKSERKYNVFQAFVMCLGFEVAVIALVLLAYFS